VCSRSVENAVVECLVNKLLKKGYLKTSQMISKQQICFSIVAEWILYHLK